MKLHFIRHAQPTTKGVLLGRTDAHLQYPVALSRYAKSLIGSRFDTIYVSPLERTQQTLDALNVSGDVVLDSAIVECDFGHWDGKTYEWLWRHAAQIGQFWSDPWSVTPPDGETMTDFATRCHGFLKRLLNTSKAEENVLVISHAGVLKFVYFHVLGIEEPSGTQLAAIEFNYLTGFSLDVFIDDQGVRWPKVVF
ncbi:histidine phosphatase family protein [Pseudoalteromonas xiamenensis]|uniref:histidine phosphatase family protein n=1 Tax=Pseudoalteromonas xiamenensis TaxID=882626 RepID=UPI0027E47A22|nr:histidine phosphatase family protein [Pseudoalteromonas xiamenensis]WMN59184.1 histidine phosphatase family protein [Pseudoalteromonas xiamenensis]